MAYNSKNILDFCLCYDEDISISLEGIERMNGMQVFREHYDKIFKTCPKLNVEILERIVLQNHVIDIEEIHGHSSSASCQTVTAKYSFKEGLISKVEFFKYNKE